MTRNEKILSHVRRDMKILELGPSYSPVVTRADGWNCHSLDHATAEELREIYRGAPNVDVSRIQEVDFVWKDGPIADAIPPDQRGTFDACIGSHMIEHIPDLVAFFASLETILKPDGIISLVVPDKRYCFDYFQPITMTGDVIEAHCAGRTRHTARAKFNAKAYMAQAGADISWGQVPTALLHLRDGDVRGAATDMVAEWKRGSDVYEDVHAWYSTVSSFRLVLLELAMAGLISFREKSYYDTSHCEFFVTLDRSPSTRVEQEEQQLRLDLLKCMLLDVRDQTDRLIEGPNYVGRP